MKKSTTHLTRRAALARIGASLAATCLPARLLHAAEGLRFSQDPFTLGIASGYPGPGSVVLWTRLAPTPFAPNGGLSADDAIPCNGKSRPMKACGKSCRAERTTRPRAGVIPCTPSPPVSSRDATTGIDSPPAACAANRTDAHRTERRYREQTTSGSRSRRASSTSMAISWAIATCSTTTSIVIVHVGDYIYEESWGQKRIRSHAAPEIITLDDYRARYALYKGESELKRAHAMHPWLVTWDDHEVENDYAGWMSENDDPQGLVPDAARGSVSSVLRAHARAEPSIPLGPDMRLIRDRSFGQLASFCMLDTRQYRSPLACTEPGRRGSRSTNCEELKDPTRTKLGPAQEGWLSARMAVEQVTLESVRVGHGDGLHRRSCPAPARGSGTTAGTAIPRPARDS